MPGDMAQRISMARIDNQTRRNRVYAARRLIYEKNVQVNSSAIEDLLRETSSVPTMVCIPDFFLNFVDLLVIDHANRMPSQRSFRLLDSIYTLPYFQISCTKLSWGAGERFLFTSCEFYNLTTSNCLWN